MSRRIPLVAATLVAVAFVVYLLPGLLPGGTVTGLLGPRAFDPVARARLDADLRIDWPLPARFGEWLLGAIAGDLGRSVVDGADVAPRIGVALPRSLPLALVVVAVTLVLARRTRFVVDATTAGLIAIASLGLERLAGTGGLGDVLARASARRDLMTVWGAVLVIMTLGALVAAAARVPAVVASRPRPVSTVAAWAAGAWLVLFPAVAAFAPRLPFRDPGRIDVTAARRGPGVAHLLGTDDLGRDVLARTVYGARVSLGVAVGAVLIALVAGAAYGALVERADIRLHGGARAWVAMLAGFPWPLLALGLVAFGGREPDRFMLWVAVALVVPVGWATRAALRALREGPPAVASDGVARHLGFAAGAVAARLLAVAIVLEGLLGTLRLAPDVRLGWSVDLQGAMGAAAPATLLAIAVAVGLTAASLMSVGRVLTSLAAGAASGATGPSTAPRAVPGHPAR